MMKSRRRKCGAPTEAAESTPHSASYPSSARSPSNKRWNVLHDDEAGSQFANDALELAPEPGSGPGEPGPFAGDADVLAGEAAADEIDGGKGSSACVPDISHRPVNAGPVLAQHPARARVHLDLPHRAGAEGGLEPEL